MRVYRVMGKDEWRDLILNREEALKRDANGRRVRFKWFATDLGYIASVLARKVYKNRKVQDAYKFIVCMEVEGYWVRKKELGYINLGLDTKMPFELKDIYWVDDVSDWFEREGRRLVSPLMYYWNRYGELVTVVGSREFRNIVKNGNLYDRPWFVRADKFQDMLKGLEV